MAGGATTLCFGKGNMTTDEKVGAVRLRLLLPSGGKGAAAVLANFSALTSLGAAKLRQSVGLLEMQMEFAIDFGVRLKRRMHVDLGEDHTRCAQVVDKLRSQDSVESESYLSRNMMPAFQSGGSRECVIRSLLVRLGQRSRGGGMFRHWKVA